MIKLIIFDIAGVLNNNSDFDMYQYIAKKSGHLYEEVEREILPFQHAAERGEISEREGLKQFFKKMNMQLNPIEVIKKEESLQQRTKEYEN